LEGASIVGATIISILLYLLILIGFSSILFTLLSSIWGTNEPVIAYLLSLIMTHLLLQSVGQLKDK